VCPMKSPAFYTASVVTFNPNVFNPTRVFELSNGVSANKPPPSNPWRYIYAFFAWHC
jgi:hypothetical protein